jgi:predicted MFS family arabinose efflux permease
MVALLAFLQFTLVLDFMILSPLGAQLLPALEIAPARFGLVVSAYAFAAGVSGFLAAGFADRFDRKKLLLVFYVGFLLGTLSCGLAPSYEVLLLARIVTGLFGGVIGSITFAIIADVFPPHLRGRVIGLVQTAFAASQVLGIPIGLALANRFDWHAPFLMISAVVAAVGVVIAWKVRPVVGHLALQHDRNAFAHLLGTLRRPDYLRSFAATTVMMTSGFLMLPFASAFSVNNLGVALDELPSIYLATGLASLVLGPALGKLADRVNRFAIFAGASLLACAMILYFTRLGPTPLSTVIVINVILFAGIVGRIVSSTSLTLAVPDPANRGAFLAVGSSLQQLAGGLAANLAGAIVVRTGAGPLGRYDLLGEVAVAGMVLTVLLTWSVYKDVTAKSGVGTRVSSHRSTAE